MIEKQLAFQYKARYFVSGKLQENTRRIWFVLHGYGQLASFFIRKFDPVLDAHTAVVAPEGLSHFYLQGFQGRVGATWMTKENRLPAIENYVAYLTEVYRQVAEVCDLSDKEVILLGFSQGVSTLIRWVYHAKVKFDKIMLWAGTFPKEIPVEEIAPLFYQKPCYYVYGRQDPFFVNIEVPQQVQKFNEAGLDVQLISFEGKHEIKPQILKGI